MSIFRRSAGVLGVRVVGMAGQLGLFVLAARTLDLRAVGYFAAYAALLMLARQILPLGGDIVLMRYVDPAAERDTSGGLPSRLALTAVPMVATVSLVVALASAGFLAWRGAAAGVHMPWPVDLMIVLSIVAVALAGLAAGVLRARGSAVQAQLPESLVQPVLAAVLYGGVALAGHDSLTWLVTAQTVGVLVALTICVVLVLRHPVGPPVDAQVRNDFRRSSWTVLRGTVWTSIGARAGTLFVLGLGGAQAAALYEAGLKVQLVGTNVTWAVGLATAPAFAAMHARGDRAGVERTLARGTLMTLVPAGAVVVLLVLVGPVAMTVFGGSYRTAFPTAVVLGVVALVDASTGPIGYLYNMTGHERVGTRCNLLQMITVVVLVPPLTLAAGALGAAFGVLAGVVLRNVLLAAWLPGSVGVRSGLVALAAPRRTPATEAGIGPEEGVRRG